MPVRSEYIVFDWASTKHTHVVSKVPFERQWSSMFGEQTIASMIEVTEIESSKKFNIESCTIVLKAGINTSPSLVSPPCEQDLACHSYYSSPLISSLPLVEQQSSTVHSDSLSLLVNGEISSRATPVTLI